jgi:hypothetical protein
MSTGVIPEFGEKMHVNRVLTKSVFQIFLQLMGGPLSTGSAHSVFWNLWDLSR